MLDFFRKNSSSFGIKLIIGAIVLVFVFFGVGTLSQRNVNLIAEVDGIPIMRSEFSNQYNSLLNKYSQYYQGNIPSELQIRIQQESLDTIINRKLMIKEAIEAGFDITELELSKSIQNNPIFMTDNRFDRKKYKDSFDQIPTETISDFEQQQNEKLLLEKLFKFILNGVTVSRQSIELEQIKNETEIQIKVLELDTNQITSKIELSQEITKKYYDTHQDLFRQNEKVVIDYIEILKSDFNTNFKIREKQISRYYEKHEFTFPKQADLSHILILLKSQDKKALEKAQNKINSIYKRLQSKSIQFSKIATKLSEDPSASSNAGRLGMGPLDRFPVFTPYLKDLKTGEITRPFQSQVGFHILKINKLIPSKKLTLDQVRSKIEEKLIAKKKERKLQNLFKKLQDQIANKIILTAIANVQNKNIKTSKPFDEQGKLKGFGTLREVYKEILGNLSKEEMSVIQSDSKSILVFKVNQVVPESTKPFTEVEENVKALALAQEKTDFMKNRFEELKKEIKTPNDFEDYSKKQKKQSIKIKFKYSDQQIPNIGNSPKFHKAVFSMKKETDVIGIKNGDKYYLVLKLTKLPGKTEKDPTQLENSILQAKQTLANHIQKSLIKKARIIAKKNKEIKYYSVPGSS